jgi:phytol kinase
VNPWVGIALVASALLGLLLVAKPCIASVGGSVELARKLVHVGMGMICLSFPWVFDELWPVGVLALVATIGLVVVRWVPGLRGGIGAALHGVERWSLGELLFAPAVALVFFLAKGEVLRFVIPVLVLTLADGAGAIAGTRWGRSKYVIGSSWKSVEGSAAFLFFAVACIAGSLLVFGDVAVEKTIWISLTVGLLATMAEGLADRGSDNLVLPLWVFFLLDRFLLMDSAGIMWRCAALVGLLVVVILSGKYSTLDGAALLAAGLLGYGLAVLGGVWFLVPVLGFFLIHLATSFRFGLMKDLRHGREPVFGVALATLSWAAAKPWVGEPVALLGCGLGAAAALVTTHASTQRYLKREGRALLELIVKVLVMVLGPVLWVLGSTEAWWLAGVAMLLALGAVFVDRRVEEKLGAGGRGCWIMRGMLALIGSMVALWML